MKVLCVIDGLGAGGAERSLAELLPTMAAAGITTSVAHLYYRPVGVDAAVREMGVPIHHLTAARLLPRARQLRRVIVDERPDVVHATLLESNLAARLAAWRTPARVLTSLVNTPYDEARALDPNVSRRALRVMRVIDGWTSRHLTDAFHAITGAVKDAAVRDLGVDPARVAVIERGRDPERLGRPSAERRAAARRALHLADDDEVVVTVGRQEHQKGQVHLVDAVGHLRARRPRLVLLVAGRAGHATADLERRRAAAGAGEHVRFLGHRDDVAEVLAAADVFVFPSLWEGLGGSVIEAMALGLPVVASDIPALREVLDDGGNATLVPPADPAALAAAIGALLDDPARRAAFGASSRARFEERFTLDRSAAAMVALYERVAAGRLATSS